MTKLNKKIATKVIKKENSIEVIYHYTTVFFYDKIKNLVILNSNGWNTSTTKSRINQAISEFIENANISLFQKNYNWYVKMPAGNIVEFFDGMLIELK